MIMDTLGKTGYVVERILSDDDLSELRQRINRQMSHVLSSHIGSMPSEEGESADDILSVYLNICDRFEHGKVWTKKNRMLSSEDTEWFESCESIRNLFDRYGCTRVSDEDQLKRSNYYWRITRPGESQDVGPLHRDEWFWLLNNEFGEDLKGLRRIKVWIAIQTCPGKNGLLVVPGSQKRLDIAWDSRESDTINKPILVTEIAPETVVLLDTKAGDGVVFHDRLVHGGALNEHSECRCSIEFTMLVRNVERS